MRVGICIPCIGNHIQFLKKCIETFDFQTQKPDVISISLSSYTSGDLNFETKIPILVEITSSNNSASKNRNIAAKRIADMVDILIFFDADDFIHQAAVEYTKHYFIKFKGDFLLHRYLDYPKEKFLNFKSRNYPWPELSGDLDDNSYAEAKRDICGRLDFYSNNNEKCHHANGHLTCKVEVWKDIPWPEEYGNMGEDSEYNYRIFSKGYKYMYTQDILSLYCK